MAAKIAAAGIVKIQAQTILPATRHFTADKRVVEATPAMAPVMVCVVDTGIPRNVAANRVAAPAVSALKPPTGRSLVIFEPMVWTMRQPPDKVPRAIAACASNTTYSGILGKDPWAP